MVLQEFLPYFDEFFILSFAIKDHISCLRRIKVEFIFIMHLQKKCQVFPVVSIVISSANLVNAHLKSALFMSFT